ncbi:hypothetical protein RHMOL_Rhmol08G0020900 [Rhododendron molle]|uniref:Uncharacterized protein n=1 Tax=Rhododendron molle TaxID=49168 RepID=A0ACC0MIU0_RHOML|nr:hypothetical protein RHMOL_Rhmol08G0020900 [Rhododendron molle]
MTDMDGAPPSPSHGDNNGFNSSGVRDHLLWVTTITNSKDSSTLVISTKKEDQTATASSTPTKVSEINGGNTAAVAASNGGGVLGLFSRPQAPQAKAFRPPICKHVLDFYYDGLNWSFSNFHQPHQGPTSADISNVSDDHRQNSTLHVPAELLHMSYHGCRKKNDSCKKYLTYVSETSQNS